MQMNVNGTIGQAVAQYVGGTVLELEVVLDPHVAGCYAVQALVKPERGNATIVQFLITDVPISNVTCDHLEEVTFTSWPPTSRQPGSSFNR